MRKADLVAGCSGNASKQNNGVGRHYYRVFILDKYSVGVHPYIFLKRRLKYAASEKPHS